MGSGHAALPFHRKTEAENKWKKVALGFWLDSGCPCVLLGGSSRTATRLWACGRFLWARQGERIPSSLGQRLGI